MSAGIDYSGGLANRDPETGIHFGVISCNSTNEGLEEFEANYPDPGCPKCEGAVTENFPDNFTGRGQYYCEYCDKGFGDECTADEPTDFSYEKDGYELSDAFDGTCIFVLKSPFYTFAKFCSPCAPGAGDLDSPTDEDGVKSYCLGFDWFDETSEHQKCPYRVFRVEDDVEVFE